MQIAFTAVNGMQIAETPQGRMVIRTAPGVGVQGLFYPVSGRAQVWVAGGKYRGKSQVATAMLAEWRKYVGLDEIRSFV